MTTHTTPPNHTGRTRHAGQTGQVLPVRLGDLFDRHEIILGLRALAAFLEANPGVPVSRHGFDLLVSIRADNDTEAAAVVDQAAALMGVKVTDDTHRGGHYTATRFFGSVSYTVFHIPEHIRRHEDARDSYRTNIRPDEQDEGQDTGQAVA